MKYSVNTTKYFKKNNVYLNSQILTLIILFSNLLKNNAL